MKNRGPAAVTAARWMQRLLAGDWINGIYEDCRRVAARSAKDAGAASVSPATFFRACLEALPLPVEVDESMLLRIPASGPVIVVANHPLGGADAVVLAALVTALRDDARIMANHFVCRIPEAAPALIPVDPFAGPDAPRRNAAPLRAALAHLEAGGLLAAFPAGEVAAWNPRTRRISDRPWNRHVGFLVRRTKATV
ncbi:MAG TPA: 1-acyl-sn-glycerol-3-phosphate acyltransferase, partial [Longimicrobiaceae bacterium]|nr:1-acyl-sn-glycerol-3-phosphate acyltransferase [Longimicrobiaceae bacterium]